MQPQYVDFKMTFCTYEMPYFGHKRKPKLNLTSNKKIGIQPFEQITQACIFEILGLEM